MKVTAEQTFVDESGRRRGRICRREDGRFQVVTETLCEPTEEHEAYWENDYPPSGLFARRDDANQHLLALIPCATELPWIAPCTFEIDVGPYPEPTSLTTAYGRSRK